MVISGMVYGIVLPTLVPSENPDETSLCRPRTHHGFAMALVSAPAHPRGALAAAVAAAATGGGATGARSC